MEKEEREPASGDWKRPTGMTQQGSREVETSEMERRLPHNTNNNSNPRRGSGLGNTI